MRENVVSLVGISEQDFKVIANIYFFYYFVCVCKRVLGRKEAEIGYFNLLIWPILGANEKVYENFYCNLLARVLSIDHQYVKQDINHYSTMIV